MFANMPQYHVIVPANVQPGQNFVARIGQSGQMMEVTCPESAKSGTLVIITLEDPGAPAPDTSSNPSTMQTALREGGLNLDAAYKTAQEHGKPRSDDTGSVSRSGFDKGDVHAGTSARQPHQGNVFDAIPGQSLSITAPGSASALPLHLHSAGHDGINSTAVEVGRASGVKAGAPRPRGRPPGSRGRGRGVALGADVNAGAGGRRCERAKRAINYQEDDVVEAPLLDDKSSADSAGNSGRGRGSDSGAVLPRKRGRPAKVPGGCGRDQYQASAFRERPGGGNGIKAVECDDRLGYEVVDSEACDAGNSRSSRDWFDLSQRAHDEFATDLSYAAYLAGEFHSSCANLLEGSSLLSSRIGLAARGLSSLSLPYPGCPPLSEGKGACPVPSSINHAPIRMCTTTDCARGKLVGARRVQSLFFSCT